MESLTLYGRAFGPGALPLLRRHEKRCIREDLADFLEAWYSPSPVVEVHSSGSTGAPKALLAEKERMRASARMTLSFLGLQKGDSALLCMPLRYIGAKMMVVRALEGGLDLWCEEPSGHPLRSLKEPPRFLAMTPAQAVSSLEDAHEAALLRGTGQLILGGSAISAELARSLRSFPHHVWSTYGMTETLSHIALRRLSGPQASEWYTPFAGVGLRLTEEGCLAILAPSVCDKEIVTNDLAELDAEGRFRILGRRDNVINSGGIKLHIEELEETLALPRPFRITSVPDAHFGEAVCLLVEGKAPDLAPYFARLHPYARPKRVFFVEKLPLTGSGKPDRATARALARRLMEEAPASPAGIGPLCADAPAGRNHAAEAPRSAPPLPGRDRQKTQEEHDEGSRHA